MEKVLNKIKEFKLHHLGILLIVLLVLLLTQTYFIQNLLKSKSELNKSFLNVQKNYNALKNQDQYKINQKQQEEIKNIKVEYKKSIDLLEQIQDLRAQKQDTSDLDKLYAQVVRYLVEFNYASADAQLKSLSSSIDSKNSKLTANNQNSVPISASQSNTPPGSGYGFQSVQTDVGTFNIAIIASDLNSTRVIVDTASDSDCSNNCPAMSLADYASRSGAYAGINGTFFCPPEYPQCAGKTNSFDTLLMNKNKHYFNSDNNVYSTVPLVYFSGNSMGVRGHSSDWGRDTSVDSVIAMQPLLISGGNIVFSSSDDPKFNGKGPRGFIANKGNMVYIGDVFNATMSESAHVLKTLGMDNALNLDEGGSTALWFGGYKTGPGRNIPNAVLFVHK